jgi:hypothetical protein
MEFLVGPEQPVHNLNIFRSSVRLLRQLLRLRKMQSILLLGYRIHTLRKQSQPVKVLVML